MAGRLSRWLSFLGFDSICPSDADDSTLLRRSRAEGRILLTRDRNLAARAGKTGILLASQNLDEQLDQVLTQLKLRGLVLPFTLCSICNVRLEDRTREQVKGNVPFYVYQTSNRFAQCPQCGRIYWEGTHWERMRQRLRRLGVWIGILAIVGCIPTIQRYPRRPPEERRAKEEWWVQEQPHEPTVKVALAGRITRCNLSSNGPFVVRMGERTSHSEPRQAWQVERHGNDLTVTAPDGRRVVDPSLPLLVEPLDEQGLVSVSGELYRGRLWIRRAQRNRLMVVNELPLEEYLRGVVPCEIGGERPELMEAYRAQAIACRTYALFRMAQRRYPHYDLVSTVEDQVYRGWLAEREFSDRAVADTRGLILTYDGEPVQALYHSTCGGLTAAASELWPGHNPPYLQPVHDGNGDLDQAYCRNSPLFYWTRGFTREEIARLVSKRLPQKATWKAPIAIEGIRVTERGPSGRVMAMELTSGTHTIVLKGMEIRRLFADPSRKERLLPSTQFHVTGSADGFVLRGRGKGHGCGMCQWGAMGMARRGSKYHEIVKHYYPGTEIETLY
jgi:stage II sporulation protein D